MSTINERFCQVIDDIRQRRAVSLNGIERECDLNKVLTNIRTRGIDPSASTLCAIAMRYPDYSVDWVITGRGQMLVAQNDTALAQKYQQLLSLNVILQKKLSAYEQHESQPDQTPLG